MDLTYGQSELTPMTLGATGFFANGGGYLLAGVIAAGIPILIHLLTRWRRLPVQWGAMRFLLEVYRRHRTRLRLEQWILLATRCSMLIVLGLALAGPHCAVTGVGGGFLSGGSGREFCVILDDSLSSRVREGGARRFDQLRRLAVELLSTVSPNDRVTIWRASKPVTAQQDALPMGPARARQLIEDLQPRHGRTQMPKVIGQVAAYLTDKDAQPDRAVVVVLSDFAGDSISAEDLADANLKQVSQLATVLVSQPAEPVTNIQIADLKPRWRMTVVRSDRKPAIEMAMTLRRYHLAPETSSKVKWTIKFATTPGTVDSPGDTDELGTLTRTYKWEAGQFELNSRVNLVLDHLAGWEEQSAPQGRAFVVSAQLVDAGGRMLPEDDRRATVVQLRQQLRVGLLDDTEIVSSSVQWSPRRWAQLAFLRGAGRTSEQAMATTKVINVSQVTEKDLNSFDAMMILRPDLLQPIHWKLIRQWVQNGGLLWVVMPQIGKDRDWPNRLVDGLKLDWQLSADAHLIDKKLHPDGLGVDTAADVPPALERLSSHWPQLFQSVRVFKRAELSMPPASGDKWLQTSDGQVLVGSTRLGQGTVCMLTVSLDDSWCNLVTRPAYVALINETMVRGLVQGQVGASQAVLSGQKPVLGRDWSTVDALIGRGWSGQDRGAGGDAIQLKKTGDVLQTEIPIDQPGIYQTLPLRPDLALTVNVDPIAGDTSSVVTSIRNSWIKALGGQELDHRQAGQSLLAVTSQANSGWMLLWIVLALLLIEMLLARWFSHARRADLNEESDTPAPPIQGVAG